MSIFLSTSRHESNDDISMYLADPYSFPYFHQISEVPALYKAVNSFTFIHSPKTNVPHETQSRIVEKLAKKIIARCQACPQESGWVDSCGENTCHRFCQSLRFHHAIDDDFSFGILEALINAEPMIAFTLNNWTETPLHQFVAHCGFKKNPAILASTGLQHDSGTTDDVKNSNSCDVSASVKVIDILLKAAPKSIFTANYEKSLPLHEVCGLSRLDNQDCVKFPYSSFPIRSFFWDESQTGADDNHERQSNHDNTNMQRIHLEIVQHLVDAYRKGLLFLDNKKKTPLYRAVESTHCSTEVVIYILREMESAFSSQNHPMPVKANENDKPLLMRRAILGLKNENSSTHGMEEDKIASPLGDLWNVFLSPRKTTEEDLAWFENCICTNILNNGSSKLSLSQLMTSMSAQVEKDHGRCKAGSQFPLNHLGSIWTKSLVLMCSAYHGSVEAIVSKDESEWKPVHSAIFVSAPRCIIYMVASIYPQELVKQDTNQYCDTPLSLALSKWDDLHQAWIGYDRCEGTDSNSIDGQQHPFFNMNAVQMLLSLDTSASSIQNSEGRFPLHLALANGLDWNEGTSAIFSANSHSASVQDPVTNLLPFITAASSGLNGSMLDDRHQLRSIYTLLRADPSVVTV